MPVVHPITRTEIDSQLVNTFAYAIPITEQTYLQPVQAREDARTSLAIAQLVQPIRERRFAIGRLITAEFRSHGHCSL